MNAPPAPGGAAAEGAGEEVLLEGLEAGKPVHGFTTTALYLDAADHPMGWHMPVDP